MEAPTRTISRWTTEELIGEVMWRTRSDASSLALLETKIIRARLAASDRGLAEGTQAEPTTVPDLRGVHGTVEMSLDDGGEKAPPLTASGHEVDPDTADAHAHDHTHRRLASAKFAAHPNDKLVFVPTHLWYEIGLEEAFRRIRRRRWKDNKPSPGPLRWALDLGYRLMRVS